MISIVTVNYQNLSTLETLWNSLQRNEIQDFEWIIVDNNSPTGDAEILQDYFKDEPKVFVITLNENVGFGEACNLGADFSKGEFLVFINPDIELTQYCLKTLLTTIEDSSHGGAIVVPQLVNKYQTAQENCRKFPTMLELFGRRLKNKTAEAINTDSATMVPVDWAQGSFLFMKKSFFMDLGGFDSRFFLFMEDTDLCRRCWESGWRIFLVSSARAIHGTKRLSGGHIFKAIFKKTFWIHVNSAIKYFQKYRGKKTPKVF